MGRYSRGVAEARHPYCGRRVVLASMHRNEEAISPPFQTILGVDVAAVPGLDTDELGSFSGEIARVGTMGEVAIRKAGSA
jgi:hypothetical protein